MSGHPDWEAARERRNSTAVRITRTVIQGRQPAAQDLSDFAHHDTTMERIERELDPPRTGQ